MKCIYDVDDTVHIVFYRLSIIESIHYLLTLPNADARATELSAIQGRSDFANPRLGDISNSIIAAAPSAIHTRRDVIQQCIAFIERQNMCAELEALHEKFNKLGRTLI